MTRFPVRVASTRSVIRNVTKTLLQAAVFWSILLFLVPPAIAAVERWLGLPSLPFGGGVARWAGGSLFFAASCLGVSSAMFVAVRGHGTPLPLDAASRLVTTGPYAVLRNPMAVAGLAQGLGVALWLRSPLVIAYVIAGGLFWQFVVRPREEQDLSDRFGAAYDHYRERVRCWIPVWFVRGDAASADEPGEGDRPPGRRGVS
jgi:protein-S-isoprenylcysteine O-methyltransferase Ste14